MERKEHLHAGKAKSVYSTDDPNLVVIYFRDDTSAFDGEKVEQLADKGKVNNYFNAFVMNHLAGNGIANHYVERISETESVFKKLDMIPVECVVRNVAAGSISRRLGVEEGRRFDQPLFEFFLKNDALHDPMINEHHIREFGWASADEVAFMMEQSLKANTVLTELFAKGDLQLVDFKLEFGRFGDEILLGDEFTPDGCRLWDITTQEKMDKDRFRRGLGNVVESYREVAERIGLSI